MRALKFLGAAVLAVVALAGARADDGKAKEKKAKPYPLTTCVVSGEKLGGDMGDPYVFAESGREIKLCCKSCLKDFNKDKAAFLKKLDEAEKKPKK